MSIYLGEVKDPQDDDFVSVVESNQPDGSFTFDQATGELTIGSSVEQGNYILTLVISDLNQNQPKRSTYSFGLDIFNLSPSIDKPSDFQPAFHESESESQI